MQKNPDSSAVRVALWRALHLEQEAKPYVLEDTWALRLVNPDAHWRRRPDMHAEGTKPFRASIVARSRYVEDCLEQEGEAGFSQYVILGSGLDTFAQRKGERFSSLEIFELEKPETLTWKEERLEEMGNPLGPRLHFVGCDFQRPWMESLLEAGFSKEKKALLASLGVSPYLPKEAMKESLLQIRSFAPGSFLLMTFLLPLDQVEEKDKVGYERSMAGAKAAGTPMVSFYDRREMELLAKNLGFVEVKTIATGELPYFAGRSDGFLPSTGEVFLQARVG